MKNKFWINLKKQKLNKLKKIKIEISNHIYYLFILLSKSKHKKT